ncbi:heme exporter protein CcmD [Salmonella enterica]|nr:heme exporter protein CcmD [Salmonella enterica]
MSPAFSSWSDFFAMGGYAFFVWLAVAMTVAPLALLALHTVLQRRAILRGVAQQRAREAQQRAREARMRAAQAQQEAA